MGFQSICSWRKYQGYQYMKTYRCSYHIQNWIVDAWIYCQLYKDIFCQVKKLFGDKPFQLAILGLNRINPLISYHINYKTNFLPFLRTNICALFFKLYNRYKVFLWWEGNNFKIFHQAMTIKGCLSKRKTMNDKKGNDIAMFSMTCQVLSF